MVGEFNISPISSTVQGMIAMPRISLFPPLHIRRKNGKPLSAAHANHYDESEHKEERKAKTKLKEISKMEMKLVET